MKLHWFLPSLFSLFLYAPCAWAGELIDWNFNASANRLTFTTNEGVQPRAMLVPNPTRLVIDLPGTQLGRPRINQPVGNSIREVRVGQFDENTTRIVVEIASGYTIDPTQVRVRGTTPTQWTVDIPTPQRIDSNTPINNPTPNNNNNNPPPSSNTSTDFQVTQSGLFIRLANQQNGRINVTRSRDRRRIEVELIGITLPENLVSQGPSPLNTYGVEEITFAQPSRSPARALITLKVGADSPDWLAQISRSGGLVLFPKGGTGNFNQGNNNPPPAITVATTDPSNLGIATINSIDLLNNNQLLIRADRPVRGNGRWNNSTGVYEIRISGAQLAPQLQGPQLNNNSSVSRIRLRQESSETVLILVQPALGSQIETLNQPTEQTLALQIRPGSVNTASFPEVSIPVPPPTNPGTTPPINPNPNPNINLPPRNPSQRRLLVVIDPGHGGRDPGAIGINGLQEKDIILPISQMVAQYLRQQGIEVMMTRDSDFFVSLEGRTAMANRANANLFISIHANAISMSRPDVNGVETYYFQGTQSQRLAQAIHNSILRRINIRDRGVRTARFFVLRTANMPAVLVETGFVTGREDNPRLANPTFRQQMAEAIALGILEYIQQNRL